MVLIFVCRRYGVNMKRKRIAVLMAGLDREYQREYALGMA